MYAVRDEDTALTIALRTLAPVDVHELVSAAVSDGGDWARRRRSSNERQAMESERLYAALPSIAINLALMLAGIAAFALYRSQRKHAEYLWLGLYLVSAGAVEPAAELLEQRV